MKVNATLSSLVAAGAVLGASAMPITASAQSWGQRYEHRQSTKNTWRNLGYGGAALGVLGLATHNNTLAALGLGGAAYSAYRYEQDRKSQSSMARRRAQYFSRSSFSSGGHRYVRKTYWKGGQKYYHFVREY